MPDLFCAELEALEYTHDGLYALAFLFLQGQVSLRIHVLLTSIGELRLKLILDISEIGFKFYPQLLCLGNADFLPFIAALQASFNVHVVVLDDSKNDIRCRNTLSPLSCSEH